MGRFMLVRCIVSTVSVVVFLCGGTLTAACLTLCCAKRFPVCTLGLVALLFHTGAMLSLGVPVLAGMSSYPHCEPDLWSEEDMAHLERTPPSPFLGAWLDLVPATLLLISDCLLFVFSTGALVTRDG